MINKKQTVLVLEDNQQLARTVKTVLKHQLDLQVDWTDCLSRSIDLLDQKNYNLVIVDRMLPQSYCLEIVDYIQQFFTQTRVLMLTQKSQVDDRLKAYRKGADDYLSKPFNQEELVLKVSKLLKVYKVSQTSTFSFLNVVLSVDLGLLSINGEVLSIRPKEAEILKALIINQKIVLSKQKLIDMIWPELDKQPAENTIEVYIRRLRKMLGSHGQYIQTKRGYGYYLDIGSKQ